MAESSHAGIRYVKYWQTIPDNLSKAGWSWGRVSAIDFDGRTIWIADWHRGDGMGFGVHADEEMGRDSRRRGVLGGSLTIVTEQAPTLLYLSLLNFSLMG